MKTVKVRVIGKSQAIANLCASLAFGSIAFEFDPMPGSGYQFLVNPKHKDVLNEIISNHKDVIRAEHDDEQPILAKVEATFDNTS